MNCKTYIYFLACIILFLFGLETKDKKLLKKAISVYEEMRTRFPYRMEGMDYYSTALWHQRDSNKLSMLAQHCSEIEKLSPETWVVIGNCFNLSKCRDFSIKYFKRAT